MPRQFGRAPVIGDVDLAIALLGYDGTASPDFVEARTLMTQEAGHSYPKRRALVDAVPEDLLRPVDLKSGVDSWRAQLVTKLLLGPAHDVAVGALTNSPLTISTRCGNRCAGSRRRTSRRTRPRPTRTRNTRGSAGTRGATRASPGSRSRPTYGGQDGGFLAHAIAVEEVARVCASSSLFTFISKLGMTPVLDHGTEALKQKYVARVASGECQASYCLSEAEAGSDVAGMRTRAVRDGDHYVLNGAQDVDYERGRQRLLHRLRQDQP